MGKTYNTYQAMRVTLENRLKRLITKRVKIDKEIEDVKTLIEKLDKNQKKGGDKK